MENIYIFRGLDTIPDEDLFSYLQGVVEGASDEQTRFAMEALQQLQRRHNVVGIAIRCGLNSDECADVLQTSWITVWEKRHQFRGASTFKAWLYRIAKNAALDMVECKQRKTWGLLMSQLKAENSTEEDSTGDLLERVVDDSASSEDVVCGASVAAQIRGALEELPQPYKVIFHLRVVQEMSYREIGEYLHRRGLTTKPLNAQAVERQYQTARRRLEKRCIHLR